jgi:hypothetical protein
VVGYAPVTLKTGLICHIQISSPCGPGQYPGTTRGLFIGAPADNVTPKHRIFLNFGQSAGGLPGALWVTGVEYKIDGGTFNFGMTPGGTVTN